jgi:hypothetical protein
MLIYTVILLERIINTGIAAARADNAVLLNGSVS